MAKFLSFFVFVSILGMTNAMASSDLSSKIKKMNWNGIEVIWLVNNKIPKFDLSIYFSDGASSDNRYRLGETEMMFDLLSAGTTRYNQDQISDSIDFYGSQISSSVYHEYTAFSVGGLIKYMLPTMKMVCHLFQDARYPDTEVKSFRKRLANQIKNMASDKSSLANRAYRKVALKDTPFAYPSSGELETIKKIGSRSLLKKLKYFNQKVYKRIYITGPSQIKQLEHVFQHDCRWKGDGGYKRYTDISYKTKNRDEPTIYFLSSPDANQAQIRLGKLLGPELLSESSELMSLAYGFLGGGFTSQLIQELRVKRGLTYSASAYAGNQRTYGRSLISTFSKNETATETIKVIKEILQKHITHPIEPSKLELTKNYLAGSHLFSFESSRAFLNNLLFFDHIGKNYNDLYEFPKKVRSFSSEHVSNMLKKLYDWEDLTIFVLGDESLKKELSSLGKLKEVKMKDVL